MYISLTNWENVWKYCLSVMGRSKHHSFHNILREIYIVLIHAMYQNTRPTETNVLVHSMSLYNVYLSYELWKFMKIYPFCYGSKYNTYQNFWLGEMNVNFSYKLGTCMKILPSIFLYFICISASKFCLNRVQLWKWKSKMASSLLGVDIFLLITSVLDELCRCAICQTTPWNKTSCLTYSGFLAYIYWKTLKEKFFLTVPIRWMSMIQSTLPFQVHIFWFRLRFLIVGTQKRLASERLLSSNTDLFQIFFSNCVTLTKTFA